MLIKSRKLRLFCLNIVGLLLLSAPLLAAAQIESTIDTVGMTSGLPGGVSSVYELLINFMLWLLRILTVLAVLAFIISGLMFILSGANKNLADKARDGVQFAIIGIGVALSGYIIIRLIAQLLGAGWDGY